ncbi:RNA-binding (RRM/RBD/RNP motifs) family protein [Striga asiatica]|uniref:RNA-binding (RRM/RBD/RNP motifs) family protein n=1 Tax=Striga asiatica TaxID=4170 RepID=A0A5A7RCL7_STRAF|nr:RNA-binding (RRM/RBD/RNP motifs) family protein [Striga asiatica]
MDTYEATKVVMSRIQALDPDNASKIMGFVLLQDLGEKEMIRLAFGPEALLQSHISRAKACLGIHPSNPSAPNSPFPRTSPRVVIPTAGDGGGSNPSSPAAAAAAFQRASPRPFSYAAALNSAANNGISSGSSSSGSGGLGYEYGNRFPFMDDSVVDPVMSPSGRSDSLLFHCGEDAGGAQTPHQFHRRSCSVNDAAFLGNLEEGGGGAGNGWRPCMYFARGFCKNGGLCKFSHGEFGEGIEVGSPSKGVSGFDEILRIKALQQQRLAAVASAGGNHPFGYSKCMDLLNESPRFDRSEFSQMLAGGLNSSSRQIYLTFPAESTFKEEDVSSYFNMFGPVQDVRIPYQQKRMFGFVTFVYAETVKLILAKGNPHFVCDSRVLVKPYKEKGKIPDKKHQQHLERGDYSACLSPSALDSRDHMDLPFGSRMVFNSQEVLLRRKLEQEAELHNAIERQSRRIMSLQLMDLKNQHNNHHFLPGLQASGISISSPRQAKLLMIQNFNLSSDDSNLENSEDLDGGREAVKSPPIATDQKLLLEGVDSNKQQGSNNADSVLPESLELVLPDNLFASPTKLAAEHKSVFSQASASSTDDNIPVTISASNNIASLKSCYLQMPSKLGYLADIWVCLLGKKPIKCPHSHMGY